jgi:DNA-binding transcriptional MerR regulator
MITRGKLAKATGTKIETIRFYEKIGLLAPPERTAGNYRAYQQVDVDRLSFVRRARDLGFSLDQVRAAGGGRAEDFRPARAQARAVEPDRTMRSGYDCGMPDHRRFGASCN